MNKRGLIIFKAIIAITMLNACSDSDLQLPEAEKDQQGELYLADVQELETWMKNNQEVNKTRNLGEFQYSLNYISQDQMALKELRKENPTKEEMLEAKSHYSDLLYFKFNLKVEDFQDEVLKYGVKSNSEYTERVSYASFNFNRDWILVTGTDTLSCVLHEYERTFNLPSGLNFLLAFPLVDDKKNIQLIYTDQLFRNGIIKFYFNNLTVPYLKINS